MRGYPNVFGKDVGRFVGKLYLCVAESIVPMHVLTCCFPFCMRDRLQEELQCLVALKVIEATDEPIEWTAMLAVTHKESGELRNSIDNSGLNHCSD